MEKYLLQVAPMIDSRLEAYEREHMVSKCWEECLAELEHTPLVWPQVIEPSRMLCAKSNRGGIGVIKNKAIQLGNAHCVSGYLFSKACDGAICMSLPDSGSDLDELLQWNRQMDEAQGAPAFHPAPLGASFGAGHGNYFLRCVNGKTKCDVCHSAPSGMLDPGDLGNRYPGLGKALKGLEWKVIDYRVFTKWPRLADIAQKALNTRDVSDVSELEGLCSMAAAAKSYAATAVLWDAVLEDSIVSKPMWQPWANSILAMAKCTPAELIAELGIVYAAMTDTPAGPSSSATPQVIKTLSSVHLGGAVYDRIAKMQIPGLLQPHRMKCAIVLGASMCPQRLVDSGKATLISATTISALTTKGQKLNALIVAEMVLDIASDSLQALSLPLSKLYGRLACRLAYHLTGVGSKSMDAKCYDNMYSVCVATHMEATHDKRKGCNHVTRSNIE
jgi:hypothetical protein